MPRVVINPALPNRAAIDNEIAGLRGLDVGPAVSPPLLHGQPERAGSIYWVQAAEVEALIGSAVREHLEHSTEIPDRHRCVRSAGLRTWRVRPMIVALVGELGLHLSSDVSPRNWPSRMMVSGTIDADDVERHR